MRAKTSACAVGKRVAYKGMREASGAIAIPQGSFRKRFLVVDNEENFLRVYDTGAAKKPRDKLKVPATAHKAGKNKKQSNIDLEAATWLDGRAVFTGSLGRNSKGKPRPSRRKFLAVKLDVGSDSVRLKGRVRGSDKLVPALANLDDDLARAIGNPRKREKELAPKKKGINLEGLTVAADGTSLMLGFRNPLKAGKALAVKLCNPDAVLRGAKPKLEGPYELSLGGLGIRSLEYSRGAGCYFIIAGPVKTGSGFDIFKWIEGETPERVEGARKTLAGLDDFAPEALIANRKGTRLRLFGDNEDGKKKRFPSVVLTLG